jgi:hypothetical protein
MWIIQEVAFATKLIIYYGVKTIPWPAIVDFLEVIRCLKKIFTQVKLHKKLESLLRSSMLFIWKGLRSTLEDTRTLFWLSMKLNTYRSSLSKDTRGKLFRSPRILRWSDPFLTLPSKMCAPQSLGNLARYVPTYYWGLFWKNRFSPAMEYVDTLVFTTRLRQFAISTGGKYLMVPFQATEGDVICVILGYDISFVLR